MTTVNVYLTFNGNCEEAFNYYQSIFGGDFSHVARFGEMPPNPECQVPEDQNDKIMHISLPISKETVLMGSDSSEAFGPPIVVGNNFSLSVNVGSQEEVDRIFNALADGGKVCMPVDKTFWGSYFGMLTDKFDINWMVSCELESHA
ncbi:VOC family protein [Puteibacter caeruleilacunae]|nr:VOC family protein [Puteibacter caeruleilacunae]